MTQLLIYSSVVRVNPNRHKDWSIKTGESYEFAKRVNSVPLTAIEFARAAAEYPIVFAGSEDAVMPAVILGAHASKNLYINEKGGWDASYVPGFIQRYPFVFAADEDGKNFTLCIDEGFEGCNQIGRGERLFDADGQRTQYLNSVLNFLRDYQVQFRRTQTFCAKIKELDLLQPMQAQFTLPSGERSSLSGFMTVDRERLRALAADPATELLRNNQLELIYLHLYSLRHFRAMVDRLRREEAGRDEEPATSAFLGSEESEDELTDGNREGGNGFAPG